MLGCGRDEGQSRRPYISTQSSFDWTAIIISDHDLAYSEDSLTTHLSSLSVPPRYVPALLAPSLLTPD